jgi:hypothetical protein
MIFIPSSQTEELVVSEMRGTAAYHRRPSPVGPLVTDRRAAPPPRIGADIQLNPIIRENVNRNLSKDNSQDLSSLSHQQQTSIGRETIRLR